MAGMQLSHVELVPGRLEGQEAWQSRAAALQALGQGLGGPAVLSVDRGMDKPSDI
jgi:hypothetical protein